MKNTNNVYTPKEDQIIRDSVAKQITGKGIKTAARLLGRTESACRQRWYKIKTKTPTTALENEPQKAVLPRVPTIEIISGDTKTAKIVHQEPGLILALVDKKIIRITI